MTQPLSSPTAIEAERAALGACLQDPAAAGAVLAVLRDDDCYLDSHRVILRAVRAVFSKGEQPDLVTVAGVLTARHELEAAGTSRYLAELVDLYCPTPSNHPAYCRTVQEAATRRRVMDACARTIAAMQDSSASLPEHAGHLIEDIESHLGGTGGHGRALVPVPLAEALKAWRREGEDGRQPPRIKTPIAKLNTCLGGGFGFGDIIYLCARPGVGKTALALEVARTAAQAGTGALFISREMAIGRLVRRILSQDSRIPASTVKTGLFAEAEYSLLTKSYGRLATLPVWLCSEAISLADIARVVEHWAFTPALGLVVVDYLQLVRGTKKERRLEVEEVSQGLKSLAMKCHLTVLCLSSLSRPEKGARDHRPTLADLRKSGELEHDADIVLFLQRGFQQEETTLIVAKNRDGRVGETSLRFRPEYVAFEEVQGEAS